MYYWWAQMSTDFSWGYLINLLNNPVKDTEFHGKAESSLLILQHCIPTKPAQIHMGFVCLPETMLPTQLSWLWVNGFDFLKSNWTTANKKSIEIESFFTAFCQRDLNKRLKSLAFHYWLLSNGSLDLKKWSLQGLCCRTCNHFSAYLIWQVYNKDQLAWATI